MNAPAAPTWTCFSIEIADHVAHVKLNRPEAMNALNRPFLDAADAIWVNYTWTEATPEAARREVRVSAAGGRGGQRRWRRGG